MRRKLIKVIVICLVIIGVGFGGFYGYNTYFVKKTAAATIQYYAVSAQKMNLQTSVQGTGAAYAAVSKDLSPNNSGTLKDLNVKVGDTVTAGQKLFISDSDALRKNVTSAKDNLTKQNLTLSSDENAQKVDDNKVAMDKLSVSDAKSQLEDANSQLNNMTVTAPIGGVVTAVNNGNGDSVQTGKAVLTIQDLNSIKVKVSVDELDIDKIKTGQKAEIKFDAIANKTYSGSVETIAVLGNSSNNVTKYDVVVTVNDPALIKLGMNANVTILVEDKADALVIPAEALVESNGQKFVRVQNSDNAASGSNTQAASVSSQGQAANTQAGSNRNSRVLTTSENSKLVAIKTGLETVNYIEVTEGLTEGEKVLVQLPQTTSTTNTTNRSNLGGGFGGNMGGGFGGNMNGAATQRGNSTGTKTN